MIIVGYNAATAALQVYPSAPGTTGFTIACGVVPAASQGAAVYGVRWMAVTA